MDVSRLGLFDLSVVPNSTELDPQFDQFQWVGEVERRYELWGQPGKLAVTAFLSRGRMGLFDDAIRIAQPDWPARRHRGGAAVPQPARASAFNLEQQLASDLGFFARGGISSGKVEPYEFTDVDRTIAAGLVAAGKRWGRPDDSIGFAGVINGISGEHEAFLNAGGLGILVGDGKLPNPGTERIIETYYSLPVVVVAADVRLPVRRSTPPTTRIEGRSPSSARVCTRSSERSCAHRARSAPAIFAPVARFVLQVPAGSSAPDRSLTTCERIGSRAGLSADCRRRPW